MLGNHGRSVVKAIFETPARWLARCGVTPNQVTVAGTLVTVILSIALLAQGHLAVGGIVIGIVLFADSLDGTLARLTGSVSRFGAFLDSSLDRIGDGAVFASLTYWAIAGLAPGPLRTWTIIFGLATIVGAATVPYTKARGECFDVNPKVGIAERTDRLVVALVMAGLTDFGLPDVLFPIGLGIVALASLITVVQRILYVKRHLDQETN